MLARWRAAGLILPALLTLITLPMLIGLGTWQLQRKAWKEDLIAKVTERRTVEPIAYADAMARARQNLPEAEYLRVKVTGRFDHMQERHVYAPLTSGQGWHIYTPLHPSDGQPPVFINRGWVPDNLKDTSSRQAGQMEGPVTITGLVRGPQALGWFTPESNLVENRWFARDLAGMLESLREHTAAEPQNSRFAPFFIDADAEPANPGGWPRGGVTEVRINNPHLQYVVTWYGLAITLVVMFALFARQRLAALEGQREPRA